MKMLCFFFSGDRKKKNTNLRSNEWMTYELLQEQKKKNTQKVRKFEKNSVCFFFPASREKKNTTFWDLNEWMTHQLYQGKKKYDTFGYSIESFILNKLVWLESYELSFSQMLLGGGIHTRVYVKNPKITVQNLPLPKLNSGY